MRVAIDATALGGGGGGDETMMRGLLSGLGVVAQDADRFVVLARDGVGLPSGVGEREQLPVLRMPRHPGPAHVLVGLPAALRRAGTVDLVCVVNHAPVRSAVPLALIVQDLSFHHHPEWYPWAGRQRLNRIVPRQARAAASVLTVSEHSRRDLIATYTLAPERVHVVPNTVEAPPILTAGRLDSARRWLSERGVRSPYVCCLGNVHPRKNLSRLIAAFLRARQDSRLHDLQLVVAGAHCWGPTPGELNRDSPEGAVLFVGQVGEDVREVLLRDAVVLAYLSLFEGFGLPPLEAMARGTPSLVADTTCLPEVTGGAALLVDPWDVGGIASGLVRLNTDTPLRAQVAAAGLLRWRHFDSATTGHAVRSAFAAALAPAAVSR